MDHRGPDADDDAMRRSEDLSADSDAGEDAREETLDLKQNVRTILEDIKRSHDTIYQRTFEKIALLRRHVRLFSEVLGLDGSTEAREEQKNLQTVLTELQQVAEDNRCLVWDRDRKIAYLEKRLGDAMHTPDTQWGSFSAQLMAAGAFVVVVAVVATLVIASTFSS